MAVVLVVFAGRPGSGKTTLARLLAAERRAAHLRIDAIEAAMKRSGHSRDAIGATAYVVAAEVATSCLGVGTPVVIDAVSPVPEARRGWRDLAAATGERLVMVEVRVGDRDEHRRRVERRNSDIEGLVVPSWSQVDAMDYRPWDEERDGPRVEIVNDGPAAAGLAAVLAHLPHP